MSEEQEKLNDLLFKTLEVRTVNKDCRSITDRCAKLVLQGANPNSTNSDGKTAIEVADLKGRKGARDIMIFLNISPRIRDTISSSPETYNFILNQMYSADRVQVIGG